MRTIYAITVEEFRICEIAKGGDGGVLASEELVRRNLEWVQPTHMEWVIHRVQ